MAVISKGITLYYVGNASGDNTFRETYGQGAVNEYIDSIGFKIPGLQEIGDIASAEGAGRDKIEITTLADDRHRYTDGILAEDANESIEFKFLYDPILYKAFKKDSTYDQTQDDERSTWVLLIPNGTKDSGQASQYGKFTIVGGSTVKLDGAGVNAALTMTVNITPVEPITFDTLDSLPTTTAE